MEEKISKITTATELTATTEKAKPKQTLPSEFADYTSVFSKEATDHVPPTRPYDHKINLDDSFTPKIGKVYPLSHEERKATEDFLQENLDCGKIRPLNSPQASPFFFVKKKDGGLRPCQDYRYLNEHTTRDAYPLPSSPTSLTNSKMPNCLLSLTSAGGTTTFTSKMVTNGKPPLSHIKASLNRR